MFKSPLGRRRGFTKQIGFYHGKCYSIIHPFGVGYFQLVEVMVDQVLHSDYQIAVATLLAISLDYLWS